MRGNTELKLDETTQGHRIEGGPVSEAVPNAKTRAQETLIQVYRETTGWYRETNTGNVGPDKWERAVHTLRRIEATVTRAATDNTRDGESAAGNTTLREIAKIVEKYNDDTYGEGETTARACAAYALGQMSGVIITEAAAWEVPEGWDQQAGEDGPQRARNGGCEEEEEDEKQV